MRFITSKRGTQVWTEIPAEALIDWAKQDGKEREKLTREWVGKARHGEICLYGVNLIVALELPPEVPSE